MGLPYHISELSPRRLAAFKNFLRQSGAEIFSSSNAYEVIRFRAGDEMATIYRDRTGRLKAVGPVRPAWTAFAGNRPFRAVPRARRQKGATRAELVAALVMRDGPGCFYCPAPIPPGLATIEHLLPLASGGTKHLANCALAHRECNDAAGTLSLFEKIRVREQRRFGAPADA